jgi:hypothetical protein
MSGSRRIAQLAILGSFGETAAPVFGSFGEGATPAHSA